jgi:hypothetical protein
LGLGTRPISNHFGVEFGSQSQLFPLLWIFKISFHLHLIQKYVTINSVWVDVFAMRIKVILLAPRSRHPQVSRRKHFGHGLDFVELVAFANNQK